MQPNNTFRLKRLKELQFLTQLCLAIIFVHWTWLGEWFVTCYVPPVSALLYASYRVAATGRIELGSALFLGIINFSALLFMWSFYGLRDEAIMLLPAVMFFAAMLSGIRLMLWSFAISSVNLLILGWMGQSGQWTREVPMQDLNSAFLMFLLLAMTAYGIWAVVSQLRTILDELKLENARYRQSQLQVEQLIHHDPLTGLPNRLKAREMFDTAVVRCSSNQTMVALTFLDLDNFKSINDSLGHKLGDRYLQQVAKTLSATLRESDSLCRFGGDEFVIISTNITHSKQVDALAMRILQCTATALEIDGHELTLTCSMGISMVPQDGMDFDSICQQADLAMYKAKESGRNQYRYFQSGMSEQLSQQLCMERGLRNAIELQQLSIQYQPKVCLQSGMIESVEALLRWEHPQIGEISPEVFIPLAERSGQIGMLGDWVLENAIRQCVEWHKAGLPELSIAVNVSPAQLIRGRFAQTLARLLEQYNLAGQFLLLELTESVFLEAGQELRQSLSVIQGLGVRLAIDDFGTGYSNLAYLKKFQVSQLKIDRSFVTNLMDSVENQAIVTAIVQMARSLGLTTIAEGIEDKQTADFLGQLGCDKGQGYHWSRPLEAAQMPGFLLADTPILKATAI
ncbi:putative bifunctional diguanylate cyclase/phosphodiesterase [Bowmanella denitrificans]|uniref:putative bifunctional diguanylate cyclase/phosphodiesterase n=1 Tax=Bowmanella denitrificans TaxID=366582 RepID=UPI000C9D1D18|nr:EAL domain-containing protein [Bowmanella denitrificans]